MKNNKGFSLVELIVVIAIMAILAAVAVPTFATFINKANVASDVSFVNDAEYAAQLAAASSAQKVKYVQVKVEGNLAKEIYVVIDDGTENGKKLTVTESDAAVTNTPTEVDGILEKEVASTIDWTYKFKSEKDRTVELDTTGKAFKPAGN